MLDVVSFIDKMCRSYLQKKERKDYKDFIHIKEFMAFVSCSISTIQVLPLAFNVLCFTGIDVCAHDIRFVEDNWESPVVFC